MNAPTPLNNKIDSIIELFSSGHITEALNTVQTLISQHPNEALLHNISGVCYKATGQLEIAVQSFKRAVEIKSDFADAHYNLGLTLQELNQLDDAVNCYEKALMIKPDYAEAYNNLGVTLKDLDQLEEAVKCYEKALIIKPDYPEAHNNLGNALKNLGRASKAVECFEKMLTIDPDNAEGHNNLGITLYDLGQPNAACKSYMNALAIEPDYAEAHSNLGITLNELGRFEAAEASYNRALAIAPHFAEAYSNQGDLLTDLKRLDEALVSYESAFNLKPDIIFLLGKLLHTKMHLCLWDDLSKMLAELQDKIHSNEKVMPPFPMLGLIDDPELQRKAAEIFVNENFQKNHDLPKIGLYPKHKKIRIGYFSADFKEHPVAALTAELYEIHDRNHFEIYAFSYGQEKNDRMHLRIKAGVDHFYDVCTMSYEDVAMLARSLEIDIAVDLGGSTTNSRMGIFARSAAPIQASYIGYIGTLGANYYDYLVADQTMIPEDNQKYYAEKIAYLPSFQVNDSTQSPPSTTLTRQDVGLPERGFVFCCFNNNFKITPTTFDSWGRILKKVKDSVLLIYTDNESAQINLTKEITLRGVDPSRLIFGKRLAKSEYLARYRVADLFLDTHPYNAGTTASDALRMGLPVLTYLGNSAVSRHAASILNALNLPELITATEEEYEKLAIELAKDPEKLKNIKDKLVGNLPIAPLYDTPMFTRYLESAYSMMYDRYQRGLDPDHIYAESI
jgi:protein O-GlcNAc transferase